MCVHTSDKCINKQIHESVEMKNNENTQIKSERTEPCAHNYNHNAMSETKYKSEDSMTKRMIFAMTKRIRNGKFEFRTKKL